MSDPTARERNALVVLEQMLQAKLLVAIGFECIVARYETFQASDEFDESGMEIFRASQA